MPCEPSRAAPAVFIDHITVYSYTPTRICPYSFGWHCMPFYASKWAISFRMKALRNILKSFRTKTDVNRRMYIAGAEYSILPLVGKQIYIKVRQYSHTACVDVVYVAKTYDAGRQQWQCNAMRQLLTVRRRLEGATRLDTRSGHYSTVKVWNGNKQELERTYSKDKWEKFTRDKSTWKK